MAVKFQIVLYADNTLLLYAHEQVNVIKRALAEDHNSGSKWFETNKLHLNVNKTKWSLLGLIPGTSQRLRLSVIPNIQIDGNDIEHINEYKYLKVYIDVNLNWYDHVNHMVNNISQICGVVKRVRRHHPYPLCSGISLVKELTCYITAYLNPFLITVTLLLQIQTPPT